MNRLLKAAAAILCSSITVALAWATLSFGNGAIVRFNPDPGLIRPRDHVLLLNPFRDRQPEHLAEQQLENLRRGNLSGLRAIQTGNHFLHRETQWPVLAWRLGRRWDTEGQCTLMYWVRRGGGYADEAYEEEVTFGFKQQSHQWTLTNFGAIY